MSLLRKRDSGSQLAKDIVRAVMRFASDTLDFIMPRQCCVCGDRLDYGESVFCSVCYMRLPLTGFIAAPYDNDMAKMFWGRVANIEKAFALLYHYPHSDSAHPVYALKYRKNPDIGVDLGIIMGKTMLQGGFFDGIDLILPVPLSRKRKRERKYNQSDMIALGLHDVSGLPVVTGAVRRVSFGGSQTQKDRWARATNVENAFVLVDGKKLRGRHVLIVDDVATTGATVCAFAKQVSLAGNVRISVATVAYAGQWHDDAPMPDDSDATTPQT